MLRNFSSWIVGLKMQSKIGWECLVSSTYWTCACEKEEMHFLSSLLSYNAAKKRSPMQDNCCFNVCPSFPSSNALLHLLKQKDAKVPDSCDAQITPTDRRITEYIWAYRYETMNACNIFTVTISTHKCIKSLMCTYLQTLFENSSEISYVL